MFAEGACLLFLLMFYYTTVGTDIRGLIKGMATLLQGNQEQPVVKDKVGRPKASLE